VSPRAPEFNRLFAEGSTRLFERFREGCVVTVRVAAGADLYLPSGRLVAAEPWTGFGDGAGEYAFTERVTPGSYLVQLIMADFHDPGNPQHNTRFSEVAAARLLVRDEPVATWRLGLRPGEDDARLADDEFYGYPVDGGTGSFGSVEVFDALAGHGSSVDLLDVALDLDDADDVGVFADEATGLNLVIFRSGGGDGHYPTWVGYTAEGEVACFVTDFGILTHDDDTAESALSCPPAPVYRMRGPESHASGAEMLPGQALSRRQTLTSAHGRFVFVYQDDGNLVLYPYDGSYAVWATDTYNTSVGECVLQEDGNLVVYNREGRAVWASGTDGRPVTRLVVLDGGVVTLQDAAGLVIWTTGPEPALPLSHTPLKPGEPLAARPTRALAPRTASLATPARPKRLAVPAQPAHPAVPARPAVPAVPAQPAHPAVPARPAVPAMPAQPAAPAQPARPAQPE
jgi:hypothetical protein